MENDLKVTIEFADVEDLKNFLWIMGEAKKITSTLPPLMNGLLSSILRNAKLDN